ncbi:DUF2156 domain-containing protein [Polyangium aurulentum]|uniref:DUF2156 domain-containing protein n=1 Tax=Polyangium aurulentum TaxID=2567896 RepID=UPI0010AE581C|nr:DUF2156 domain-containing protein [Polyangium aurulentum]UQA55810.1 DUF2156 domain-containing protein [Polyangium aurulentum]
MIDEADPRLRVLALLRRHGRATTSFQVLEPGLKYVFEGEEACVAYLDTGAAWVAAGPPIAPVEVTASIAKWFCARAAEAGKRACFFSVDRAFAEEAGLDAIAIGEEPEWDPRAWPETLRDSRSLREQLRRTRAKGVRARIAAVTELSEGQPLRLAIDALVQGWLASRPLAAMGFLVDVRPFEFPEERLYVVAEREGRLCGLLVAVPIYARRGWFLEDLLRADDAPNGTAETLFDLALSEMAARGAEVATLGLAPLAGEVAPALRTIRRFSRPLYNFEGVRAFKARLKPVCWRPQYLALPRGTAAAVAIGDALAAFATGGFLRFGLKTLQKQRQAVVLVLGALLLPWTMLLTVPSPPGPWFPSPAVQAAWIALDLVIAAALLVLWRGWQERLAKALSWVTAADAALTIVQVLLWNAARASTPGAWATLGVSVAAPIAATGFLWYARRLGMEAGPDEPAGRAAPKSMDTPSGRATFAPP